MTQDSIDNAARRNELRAKRYTLSFIGMLLAGGLFVGAGLGPPWAREGADHWSAISLDGAAEWYRDLGGRSVTEIQDQELFYHGLGRSMDNARNADIIIIGSSFVSFGFDGGVIEEVFERRHGLKVFNMSFAGVHSGEFTRMIATKHDLHPRLWIINADDDDGGTHFFSNSLLQSFFEDVKPIEAMGESRPAALWNVARRNIRWRLEDVLAESPLRGLVVRRSGRPIPPLYRNSRTGAMDMSRIPPYLADNNPAVRPRRSIGCHAQPDVIEAARRYVGDLRGDAVLTLVPNVGGCRQQVQEIGAALGLDVVLPPRDDYSSFDGGVHLDRRGASEMTRDFLAELEKSAAFQRVFGTAGKVGRHSPLDLSGPG